MPTRFREPNERLMLSFLASLRVLGGDQSAVIFDCRFGQSRQ